MLNYWRQATQKSLSVALAFVFMLATMPIASAQSGRESQQRQTSPATQNDSRPRRSSDATNTPPPPPPAASQTQTAEAAPGDVIDDEDDVISFQTDLTNVLFTAADKNRRFLTTLRKEDVRILEDGVEQEIFSFERQTETPLSLAFLFDVSGSQEYTIPEQKSAALAFLDSVIRPQKDEVAVLSFAGLTTVELGLSGNMSRVRRAIESVRYRAPAGYLNGRQIGTPPISDQNPTLMMTTALFDAVYDTSEQILGDAPQNTRRAIILLSDGEDRDSQIKPSLAVERAIKSEATIYSIGIGDYLNFDGINQGALRKLSERTGGRAYFPQNSDDLRAAFAQIEQELRQQYLIAYSSKNKNRDGSYRKVEIEIINPELRKQKPSLTYRQGYFARSSVAANNDTSRPASSSGNR
ncbi:MAG: VWA domain-containing protein [Pyrinomonadaceae bacterium MAG19_C2-C3]|nr:VWA domain-containing protein [Pyrinomonadaceae bacterium MAG19_C2-C3]